MLGVLTLDTVDDSWFGSGHGVQLGCKLGIWLGYRLGYELDIDLDGTKFVVGISTVGIKEVEFIYFPPPESLHH